MRITANITADNSLYNIQQGQAKLDKLNEQVGSQQNINRPSDDPINTRLLLDIGDKVKVTDQYSSNISKASTWQQVASTALTGMSQTMLTAKTLVATITNGSGDASIRQSAVSQLQALKQQIVDMGNTQMGDQYVFGGAKNTTAPFSGTAPYYAGDETAINVEIANNSTQQMNIPGNQLLTADTAVSQPYGKTNILATFDKLITAITGDPAHPNGDIASIQAGANALEDGATQIDNAESDVAARVMRLDNMSTLNTNNKNTLLNIYGNTQNVDNAKLAVELTKQQTAFNASLSATAKISQMSLLNYL